MLLDSTIDLTLRPMKYPEFFQLYRDSLKNIWTTDEIDFSIDLEHLRDKIQPQEAHLIKRLVAFFATGDNIVAHNIALNLYKHINSPEYRMFLGKTIFDEIVHVEAYLLLVDNYIKDDNEKYLAFDAYKNIDSIKQKADFCFKYMDSIFEIESLKTKEDKERFIINLICFATCIEGLFFFGAFSYVYFLRSRGLLPGLTSATNWIFRDESMHINGAMLLIKKLKVEYPDLFNKTQDIQIYKMIDEAIDIEMRFCQDALSLGVTGLSAKDMRTFLEFSADQRLIDLDMPVKYNKKNPFDFMILQDIQPLTNFFEKRVTEYQKGINTADFDLSLINEVTF